MVRGIPKTLYLPMKNQGKPFEESILKPYEKKQPPSNLKKMGVISDLGR